MEEAQRAAVPPRDYHRFIEESRGEDDGEMGAAMETHGDFIFGDGDIGGHVDEITEDLAGLGVAVSAHAACHQPIESAGKDEKRHVEVDLEADG